MVCCWQSRQNRRGGIAVQKWEYYTYSERSGPTVAPVSDAKIQQALVEAGANGWELVSSSVGSDVNGVTTAVFLFFRRPVTDSGRTGKLGLTLSVKDGRTATSVRPMSPADRAGLRVGDQVTMIDGVPLGRDHAANKRQMAGEAGSTAHITARRKKDTLDFEIVRE